MPEYLSAQALLEDARLRLDALGSTEAAMVVEGWDDKRIFQRYARRPQQIVVAGGKRLLLAARDAADDDDAKRILFIADCDFDVPLGRLSPGNGLIVTTHADAESDLISLGVLEHVVVEFVAAAVHEDRAETLSEIVQRRAVAISSCLGQIRLAALGLGEALELERLDLRKFRLENTDQVDFGKLIRAAYGTMGSTSIPLPVFADRVYESVPSYSACNGHDLLRAIADVLRRDFKARDVTADRVATCIRLSFGPELFRQWAVAERVRLWEDRVGRWVLERAAL